MADLEFSSNQAALRIRRIQLLCKSQDLDGVLLVPGVDGNFSVSNQAIGYLLEGRSNRDTLDVIKLDAQLDDIFLLIRPSDVCLYVPNSALQSRLQSLLAPFLPSLRILSPTTAEASDPDLFEENKLASFVHMLRGCKRLGIPCNLASLNSAVPSNILQPPASSNKSASGIPPGPPSPGSPRLTQIPTSNGTPPPSSSPFPASAALPQLAGPQLVALERWPLLQAYGLEGVGRSGFFTMNFQVYDIQSALHQLYGSLDSRSLAVLLQEGLPTLRQHWGEMLQALGGRPPGQRGALTEKQVAEPLVGYFAYGLLRQIQRVEQLVTLPPRVVMGPRTSDDTSAPESAPLSTCGPTPDLPPLHLVAEGADPRTGLRVARSYFLIRGTAEQDVFADADEEAEEGYSHSATTAGWAPLIADAVQLMRTYSALVEAARAAMHHFATVDGATPQSAKFVAQEVLARRVEALGVGAGQFGWGGVGGSGGAALAGRLRFALCQIDHANQVTAPAVRGSRHIKICRISLPDITSRAGPRPGAVLGGLVYGDTFLEIPPPSSSLYESLSYGAQTQGGGWRLLVLTDCVPVLVAVPAGGCEEVLSARAAKSLGRVVERGAGADPTARATRLASLRDRERRAAAAAAESQKQAARMRARRAVEEEDTGNAEDEGGSSTGVGRESQSDEEEEGGDSTAAAAAPKPKGPLPSEALGRLLTLGGGEDAVLLTGASACPTLSGTLHCFSAGLAFVESWGRSVWVLDLRRGDVLEAVTVQHLVMDATTTNNNNNNSVNSNTSTNNNITASGTANTTAGTSAAAAGAGTFGGVGVGGGGDFGEAVVFRGCGPACGLAPACHLTTNKHVALALGGMSPAARRFLLTTVLPAWHQECREVAAAASESPSSPPAPSYHKDPGAANPFPRELHGAHVYALQSSVSSGAVKEWSAVAVPDPLVASAVEELDRAELRGPLCGLDPSLESLLLPPSNSTTLTTNGSNGAPITGNITLVVGLPGADQATVAAALASMLSTDGAGGTGGGNNNSVDSVGGGGAVPVALLQPLTTTTTTAKAPNPSGGGAGLLRPEDFAAALSAATKSATTSAPESVQHVVLATSSYIGLVEQLRSLAAAVAPTSSGTVWPTGSSGLVVRWQLASVVVVLSGDVAWEEPGRGAGGVWSEGLMSQIAPGCVDCVVIGGGEAGRVSRLAQLVSERLPGVPVVRGSVRSALLRARSELLPPARERALRLGSPTAVAARSWGPLGDGDGGGGGGLMGPLHATRVVFEGSLDVGKLRDVLSEMGLPTDPDHVAPLPLADTTSTTATTPISAAHSTATQPLPAGGGLVCMYGCVRQDGGGSGGGGSADKFSELLGSRATALRAREWPLSGATVVAGAPALPSDPRAPGGDLLFLGPAADVSEGRIRHLLTRCGVTPTAAATAAATATSSSSSQGSVPPPSSSPPPTSASQLTREQRMAIRQAHLFDPLPDGYCFNGTQYFGAFGDASFEHPDMDKFISEWLADQQAKATAAAGAKAAKDPNVTKLLGPVGL